MEALFVIYLFLAGEIDRVERYLQIAYELIATLKNK